MNTPFPIGSVIRGRHRSNPERRAKVWAINPNNPKRVVLWMKSGKYSWNNAASLDVNYEAAPADEPTWPDPTHPPPSDPNDAPKTAPLVELVATEQPVCPGPTLPRPPAAEPSLPAPRPEAITDLQVHLAPDIAKRFAELFRLRSQKVRSLGGDLSPENLAMWLISEGMNHAEVTS